MGIRLVIAAQAPTWAHLSDRAHRVLTIMSTVALDTASDTRPAASFTAGHAYIARVWRGRDDITKSDLEMVRRAIKELREAGAIITTRTPIPGQFPHYKITTNGITKHELPSHSGTPEHANQACEQQPPRANY